MFSVRQREYVTGQHGKKSHPAVAHFAEELQNPFSNPYVDTHGSAQIRHRAYLSILTSSIEYKNICENTQKMQQTYPCPA